MSQHTKTLAFHFQRALINVNHWWNHVCYLSLVCLIKVHSTDFQGAAIMDSDSFDYLLFSKAGKHFKAAEESHIKKFGNYQVSGYCTFTFFPNQFWFTDAESNTVTPHSSFGF